MYLPTYIQIYLHTNIDIHTNKCLYIYLNTGKSAELVAEVDKSQRTVDTTMLLRLDSHLMCGYVNAREKRSARRVKTERSVDD